MQGRSREETYRHARWETSRECEHTRLRASSMNPFNRKELHARKTMKKVRGRGRGRGLRALPRGAVRKGGHASGGRADTPTARVFERPCRGLFPRNHVAR